MLDLAGRYAEGEGPAAGAFFFFSPQARQIFQRLVSMLRIKVINHSAR